MTRIKSVCPIYGVKDTEQTCSWYKKVLGFEVEYTEPDGSYIVLERDGCPIHIVHQVRMDVLQVTANHIELYIEVEAVEDLYNHAAEVSETEISSLDVKPWSMLEFQIKDPDGALIRVGQRLPGSRAGG